MIQNVITLATMSRVWLQEILGDYSYMNGQPHLTLDAFCDANPRTLVSRSGRQLLALHESAGKVSKELD